MQPCTGWLLQQMVGAGIVMNMSNSTATLPVNTTTCECSAYSRW